MLVKLDKRCQDILAELPETGMGSQHVDIVLNDGNTISDVPVFNGEDCETPISFDTKDIKDIRLHFIG